MPSTVALARTFEFALLFLALPLLFLYVPHRLPAIPALWILAAYCLLVLLNDPTFDRGQLWDSSTFRSEGAHILGLFALTALLIGACVYWFAPKLFLSLPRHHPLLWGLLMLLYPVFSVYPQGIVYRAFIFQRYRSLLNSDWAILAASAFAFAFVHVIFRNRLAIALTFLGGIIFGFRYLQTKSLFTSSFEHALYGCLMFTVGLGESFYHRSARLQK